MGVGFLSDGILAMLVGGVEGEREGKSPSCLFYTIVTLLNIYTKCFSLIEFLFITLYVLRQAVYLRRT